VLITDGFEKMLPMSGSLRSEALGGHRGDAYLSRLQKIRTRRGLVTDLGGAVVLTDLGDNCGARRGWDDILSYLCK
jgi:hypothetical protein